VRRTNVRWVPILALVAVGTAINYLDRTVLGIAALDLSKDLALTPVQMGLVFSAFSWSYAALQIPGGIFLDRFGTRFTYFISIAFWSFFTGVMGLVHSLSALHGKSSRITPSRSLLSIFEPSLPLTQNVAGG